MTSTLRIVVTGLIAQYPLGGVAWDYLQYVLGLARLGHDVYYVEDSGQWPYNPREGGLAVDYQWNITYLANLMNRFNLGHKWAYRLPWERTWFGLSQRQWQEVVQSADLLINVSGTVDQVDDYAAIGHRVYIDSDPMFTQIHLVQGSPHFVAQVHAHNVHFTFGETLSPLAPETGLDWRPTRQPIVLSEWRSKTSPRDVLTTVMNWTSYEDLVYNGRRYGQKDVEFMNFLTLPDLVFPTELEIAVNLGKTRRTPHALLKQHGWRLVDPDQVCPDMESYRHYIQHSKAEWSVAKQAYVAGKTGWFSCRSACYLAAGRPAVVQDTGFSSIIPVGEGLLAFTTLAEAAAAIDDLKTRYGRHAQAAYDLAAAYFNSDGVLTQLLEESFCHDATLAHSRAGLRDSRPARRPNLEQVTLPDGSHTPGP